MSWLMIRSAAVMAGLVAHVELRVSERFWLQWSEEREV